LVQRARESFTTVPNHPGDVPEGTSKAILKQAGIGADDFLQA
jgi:predicted RNA binding protein YcfA (HicA-like mRNA interferase family)